MTKKAKTPLDDVKKELFGGLNRAEVERLLDNANKEQVRLSLKVDSMQAELTRAQNEFESRGAAEEILRSQFEHLKEETEGMRARYESEIQQLREAMAQREAEGFGATANVGLDSEIDVRDYEAQIERLRYELETANSQLQDVPVLQAEIESLKNQLAETPAPYAASYTENEYSPDVSLLQLEIERLKGELNGVPELHEQIASLQGRLLDSENGAELERTTAELERAQAEIEDLNAELINLPSLLAEIENLRAQLSTSPSVAETEELHALRAEVERLHARQEFASEGTVDLDRTLVEARRILDDARNEAERERELLVEAAHHHAEEIVRRAQRQFSTEAWEIEKIRLERRRYLSMFKALLNRHLHEVEDLETEPETTDMQVAKNQFATIGAPDGEPPISLRTVPDHEGEEFRSPFSYPQADEPFHA